MKSRDKSINRFIHRLLFTDHKMLYFSQQQQENPDFNLLAGEDQSTYS